MDVSEIDFFYSEVMPDWFLPRYYFLTHQKFLLFLTTKTFLHYFQVKILYSKYVEQKNDESFSGEAAKNVEKYDWSVEAKTFPIFTKLIR